MTEENKNNNTEENKKNLKDFDSEISNKANLGDVDKSTSVELISENTSDKKSAPKENLKDKSSDGDVISEKSNLKLPFIIGKKVGMSQIFLNNGRVIPVTIIEAGPCHVSQLKSNESDGYSSVQLSFKNKKMKKTTKPLSGHFKKANISPKKYLKEFRHSNINKIEFIIYVIYWNISSSGCIT